MRNAYKILENLKGKPHLDCKCGQENDVKNGYKEIGWEVVQDFFWLRLESICRLL
jgi:hypothetical protein